MINKLNLKSDHCFFAVFDLAVSPATFEILSFLVAAEMERNRCGKKALVLLIIPNEIDSDWSSTFSANHFGEEEFERRLSNIILPAPALLPSCEFTHKFKARSEAQEFLSKLSKEQIFPEDYSVEKPVAAFTMAEVAARFIVDGLLPTLAPPKEASDTVRAWLKENVPSGKSVSLTLRETGYGIAKNSDLAVWAKITRELREKGFDLVVVRDTDKAGQVLDERFGDVLTYPEASTNLEIRCAFYEQCGLNLVGQNGPMSLCILDSKINFVSFLRADESWHDASKTAIRCSLGIDIGQQVHFLSEYQRLVWETEDVNKMMAEISLMLARLEGRETTAVIGNRSANQELMSDFSERLIGERQWGPGRVVLRELVKQEPDNARYNYLLGQAETWRNNPNIGLKYFKKAQKLGLENPNIYVSVGEALILCGEHQRAAANFILALQLDATHFQAYLGAAIALESLGQIDEAVEYLDAALVIRPENSDALHLREEMLK